jgi:hypothetical protein
MLGDRVCWFARILIPDPLHFSTSLEETTVKTYGKKDKKLRNCHICPFPPRFSSILQCCIIHCVDFDGLQDVVREEKVENFEDWWCAYGKMRRKSRASF